LQQDSSKRRKSGVGHGMLRWGKRQKTARCGIVRQEVVALNNRRQLCRLFIGRNRSFWVAGSKVLRVGRCYELTGQAGIGDGGVSTPAFVVMVPALIAVITAAAVVKVACMNATTVPEIV
jgi:hypothetical protein